MKIKITIKNGKVYHDNREQLASLIQTAEDGDYIIERTSLNEPHTEEEWRKFYFFLRDLLHESTETGYTKKELHEVIKQRIFRSLIDDYMKEDNGWINMENMQQQQFQPTTSYLTPLGWKEFVKRFKEFTMDEFKTYL